MQPQPSEAGDAGPGGRRVDDPADGAPGGPAPAAPDRPAAPGSEAAAPDLARGGDPPGRATGEPGSDPQHGSPGDPAGDLPGDPAAHPEKAGLELRKLSLEIKALTFRQSLLGRGIEVLQGALPVLAILSLVWTVFVGLQQQEAQRRDAESARFERAYAKLGSGLASERATGVAQASALLHLDGGARDKDLLTALANQLALDDNAAVRSAILAVFAGLGPATGRVALDAALHDIVDLHRVIVQSSGITPFELATAQPDDRGIYFIPSQIGGRRNDAAFDPNALNEAFMRLASLRTALLSVLGAGGRTQKMDHIYCPECDFAQMGLDLSGVSFEGAILPRSRWAGLRLNGASFRDAEIEGAEFDGAQLQGADFSAGEFNMNRLWYVADSALRNINPAIRPELYVYGQGTGAPSFVCADLKEARFENFPLVTRLDEGPLSAPPQRRRAGKPPAVSVSAVGQRDAWPMLFRGANIAGADFRDVQEIVLRPLDPKRADPYEAMNEVRTPPGYRHRFYASRVPLGYLRYYTTGQSPGQDLERDRNVEALALSFVEAVNVEHAKLPPGVPEAIRKEAAGRRVHFPGCAAYLAALPAPPGAGRSGAR